MDCMQKSSSYSEDHIFVKNNTVVKEVFVNIAQRENTDKIYVEEEASENDAIKGDRIKHVIHNYTIYNNFNMCSKASNETVNNDALLDKVVVGEFMIVEIIKARAELKEIPLKNTNSGRNEADEYKF